MFTIGGYFQYPANNRTFGNGYYRWYNWILYKRANKVLTAQYIFTDPGTWLWFIGCVCFYFWRLHVHDQYRNPRGPKGNETR